MQKNLFIVFYKQEEQNHHTFKSFFGISTKLTKVMYSKE